MFLTQFFNMCSVRGSFSTWNNMCAITITLIKVQSHHLNLGSTRVSVISIFRNISNSWDLFCLTLRDRYFVTGSLVSATHICSYFFLPLWLFISFFFFWNLIKEGLNWNGYNFHYIQTHIFWVLSNNKDWTKNYQTDVTLWFPLTFKTWIENFTHLMCNQPLLWTSKPPTSGNSLIIMLFLLWKQT